MNKKWEITCESVDLDDVQPFIRANDRGREGWEPFAVTPQTLSSSHIWFRREVDPEQVEPAKAFARAFAPHPGRVGGNGQP